MHFIGALIFLLLSLSQNSTAAAHTHDQLYKDVMERAADQWLHTFHSVLLAQPFDQEDVYKVLVRDLICNHHRIPVDQTNMEIVLVHAIQMIKNNAVIHKKMMMNPKRLPSPFKKLYQWVQRSPPFI